MVERRRGLSPGPKVRGVGTGLQVIGGARVLAGFDASIRSRFFPSVTGVCKTIQGSESNNFMDTCRAAEAGDQKFGSPGGRSVRPYIK